MKPLAELDGLGNLSATYVYGSRSNIPDYVIKAGSIYRVLADQLGSPRMGINVSNSSDVPFRADYEAFGAVTGSGLDWMPFGFASGLYDMDTRW